MAKGNIFMGTLKGRVGESVFYVSRGEQNQIKYQSNIANPQTGRQMYQRARFSNAGRFFTRGRQNYFKFAFENKKKAESDFNAFMKNNINRSVLISRSALQIEGYPAIGKFIMSKGSLQPVQTRIANDYWLASFGVAMPDGGISTVGELSRLLISTGNYEQGDILTFVFIWTVSTAYIPSAQPVGTANTTWYLKQFILNPSDTTPLSNYEMRAVTRVWDNQNFLTLTDVEDSQILATSDSGFACIHSRNTRSGLKVSTQELALGESMQEAYEYAQTSEYIDAVIADWQSSGNIEYSPQVVLKGSLSFSANPVSGVTLTEKAGSRFELSGTKFTATVPIAPTTLSIPATIMGENITADMFSAENVKGNAANYITFTQEGSNQVDVHLNTTSLSSGDYNVRIYITVDGNTQPLCNIVWTSVAIVTIVVDENGRNIQVGSQASTTSAFGISDAPALKNGDILQVNFRLKIVGALNTYDCSFTTNAFTTEDTQLTAREAGNYVFSPNWLKYTDATSIGIEDNILDIVQFGLENTTSEADTYQLTVTTITIFHSDGTGTTLVPQS